MKNTTFGHYMDKKKRESVKQLGLIEKLLNKKGFRVESFANVDPDEEPYIFVHGNVSGNSFKGIRIYKIGKDMAFRVQKENKTHPYGSAYNLPIESMYQDFLTEKDTDEQKAGKMVIEAVAKEIERFFEKSKEADRDIRQSAADAENGSIVGNSTATDYSSMILNHT